MQIRLERRSISTRRRRLGLWKKSQIRVTELYKVFKEKLEFLNCSKQENIFEVQFLDYKSKITVYQNGQRPPFLLGQDRTVTHTRV